MALIDGNARNWEYNTTTILSDHYKATVTNKLRVLSQLADPSSRRNFDIASSWAARHFGRRLQHDTLEDLRTRIRHQLEVSDPTDDLPLLSGVLPLPLSPVPPTSGAPSSADDPGTLRGTDRDVRSRSVSLFSSLSIPFSPPHRPTPLPFLPPSTLPLPPPLTSSSPPPPPPTPPTLSCPAAATEDATPSGPVLSSTPRHAP
ncbi:unnamed protein product [Arctogadus glacialis]